MTVKFAGQIPKCRNLSCFLAGDRGLFIRVPYKIVVCMGKRNLSAYLLPDIIYFNKKDLYESEGSDV